MRVFRTVGTIITIVMFIIGMYFISDSYFKSQTGSYINDRPVPKELSQESLQRYENLLKNNQVKEFNELRGDVYVKPEFVSLDLSKTNLADAYLGSTKFRDANFNDAILANVNFEYSKMSGTLQNSNLNGANIRHASWNNVDLSNADLTNADLSGTNLNGANLRGVNLTNAILLDANLRNADISNAILHNASFGNCFENEYYYEIKNSPISKEEAIARGAIYNEC